MRDFAWYVLAALYCEDMSQRRLDIAGKSYPLHMQIFATHGTTTFGVFCDIFYDSFPVRLEAYNWATHALDLERSAQAFVEIKHQADESRRWII